MIKFREVPEAPKESKEAKERLETKVVLNFLRHEDKEKPIEGQSSDEVELTEAGRQAAIDKGREEGKEGHPEVGFAVASPKPRAQHTALLRLMSASKEELTDEMDFEEAKALVNKELGFGTKVTHLPELDFHFVNEFKKRFLKAYAEEGRGLEFLLHESDELGIELGDKESWSYSKMAANIASLIAREMMVGNSFNRIASKEPNKYKKYDNHIERYLGTHQTVTECFYMKVLEKLHGREKAEEFIEIFRDKEGKANGFDFQGGFKVEIVNGPQGQEVILEGVQGFDDIELTPELLSGIISDAEELDKKIPETLQT
ncbi:hypothetical protein KKF32_02070 [Patescibacteria group bacterium]|nr:hypothetical protein [Patescibacteria group bacterium]